MTFTEIWHCAYKCDDEVKLTQFAQKLNTLLPYLLIVSEENGTEHRRHCRSVSDRHSFSKQE